MIADFFKSIGKGLLNIIIIPFYIVGWAISAVLGVFIYLFQFLKKVIKFVSGKPLNNDLPEDIEAKRIIEESKNPKKDEDVQVVRAEITDPSVGYKEADFTSPLPIEETPTPQIENNDENVDFIINEEPVIEEKVADLSENSILQIEENIDNEMAPIEEIIEDNNELNPDDNEDEEQEEIEEYQPKGTEF